MHIHFWGTRGSIPVSITADVVRAKIRKALQEAAGGEFVDDGAIDEFVRKLPMHVQGTYGSNTSCMEIRDANNSAVMICDAGSGIRDLGNHLMAVRSTRSSGRPDAIHIFISHLHWDHLSGFPFFTPAYVPGNKIIIYGFHQNLEQSFVRQQNKVNFPIALSEMQADISFRTWDVDEEHEVGGFAIKGIRQNHPGVSYGYSFEKDGKKIIYSTDAEHYEDVDNPHYPFVDFFVQADLLVFDAQYKFGESITRREHWGHSSSMVGVELAIRSRVKRLCLFHNEPTYDDETLAQYHRDAQEYATLCPENNNLEVLMAYDGLEIEI